MSTPERRYVAEASARAWQQFQRVREQTGTQRRHQESPEGTAAAQERLLGLIRAAEEELREAQRHAAKVRCVWPPSSQLAQSERLVQRTLDLIAAAQKRVDEGGATWEELRNGWEVLGRLEHTRLREQERHRKKGGR